MYTRYTKLARNPAWSDWGAEELLEVEQELEKLGQTAGVASRWLAVMGL
jgi:hypothetical protein